MASDSENLDALPALQRDRIDLNNEMAGREVGRIERFNVATGEDAGPDGRRRKESDRLGALEQLLMQDPAYRELYQRVTDRLETAEIAVIQALSAVRERITLMQDRFTEMLERASELPDGTKVFRTRDGTRAYTEDGELLTPEQMAGVHWRDDAPSWEEFTEARDARDVAVQAEQDILDFQEQVIDPARERIDSGEIILEDELRDLDEAMEAGMPDPVRRFLDPQAQSTIDAVPGSSTPDRSSDFDPSATADTGFAIPRL